MQRSSLSLLIESHCHLLLVSHRSCSHKLTQLAHGPKSPTTHQRTHAQIAEGCGCGVDVGCILYRGVA
jgi:adenylosuccinate lyase